MKNTARFPFLSSPRLPHLPSQRAPFASRLVLVVAAVCALCKGASATTVAGRPAYFVEWLGSSGTQKLDTEYVFKTDPRVETTMMLTSNADKDVAGTSTANASCFIIDYKDSAKTIYYRYHNSSYTAVSYPASILNQWVEVVWGSEVRHDGTLLKSFTTQNFSDNTARFQLFYGRTGMSGRFKRVRMYDGNVLVRDFEPAVMANGTPCMYDNVTDKCYLNTGTGTFSTGNPVSSSLTVEGDPYAVGVVTPAYGFYDNEMRVGVATNCTAPATVTAEGLSATCAGYRLYRWSANDQDWALESSGAGNSLSLTPTAAGAKVVWLWDVAADLAVSLGDAPSADVNSITVPVVVHGLGSPARPATLSLAYGISPDTLASTLVVSPNVTTLGKVQAVLHRLLPATTYYYKAVLTANDGSGDTVKSEVAHAITVASPDFQVPFGYTQLDYIRTTGAQYIDTGLYPSRALRVEETLSTTDTGTDKMTFGVRNAGYNFLLWFGTSAGTSANPCIGSSGNIGSKSTGKTSGKKWTLYMGPGGIYADSTTLYTESGLSSYITAGRSTLPLLLFGLSNNGSVDSRKYIGNCYSFKAYEDDVLVRDYIPARRDVDGAVGLYDVARGVFQTSATATAFAAGPATILPLTATEVIENEALASISIDFAADGSEARTLLAAWGPVHGGGDPADWLATNVVATVAADATNCVWSVPADWGSDSNLVVRFYFDGTPVQWSNAIFWHPYAMPSVTDVALDGTGGDTLVVSGNLAFFPGENCTLSVYTGDTVDGLTNAWTGLAGATLSETGEFTLSLFESDTSAARYLAPGSTLYATVQAVSDGQVSRTPPVLVTLSALPVFATPSTSVSRHEVTFTGRLTNLGMNGAATVRLYIGPSTAAEEELVAVESPVTVTSTADSFSIAHYFPDLSTDYKWQFRAMTTSAGGTATRETRTGVATVTTLDTTTYTWKTSVASGNWSDPANWTDNQGGDCYGYPQSSAASAVFPAGTDANVVFTEKLTIGSLNLAAGPTVTFSQGGASTNATKLTTGTLTMHNNASRGGSITLDGVAIASTSGDTLIDTARALHLVNGANLHFAGVFGQQAANDVRVLDGSFLSCNGTYFGGGTLIISNSTIYSRLHDVAGRNTRGGHIVFQGDHPLFYHSNKAASFYSGLANANVQLDFLVPAGGYAAAPIRAISTQNYYMGNYSGSAGSCALTVNVLDESPANFVDGTVTTRLISWPKGISKTMVLEGNLPAYGAATDDAFVWGSGTYPTTLDVTINGSSHSSQLQISCEPAVIVSDTLDPAIGYTPLAPGATVECAVPSGYVYASESIRGLCTGWKLYDVDPDTLERTFAESGATTNCTVTGNGGWRDLEWQWHVEYLVTASGAGGAYSPAAQWVAHGGTATVATTPDAGNYLYAWTTTGPDTVPVSTNATFTVTGPAVLTPVYRGCFWVAPDGDNANDGLTRATAKATVTAALALASSTGGDKVLIADGIYTNMPAATLSKPCIVESEHGAGATKFFSNTSGSTAFTLTHADAVLRGVTIFSDRSTDLKKHVLNINPAGTAVDCVVSNLYNSEHPTHIGGGTMERCTFIHISAGSSKPSAIRMNGGAVRNCRFIGNVGSDASYGAAISQNGGTLYNCLICCNTNNSSGPSAVMQNNGSIESCTIVDNYTKGTFAAAVWVNPDRVVRNTIIYGNRNPYGEHDTRGPGAFSYCATGSTPPAGTGNFQLGGDPFADRAAGDYRVLAGPTIDAGSSQSWMSGVTDFYGNPRIIGSKPDIGCHEAAAGALAVAATSSATFAVADGAISFTASPAGTNLTGLAYTWVVTDQTGATVATVSGDTTGTFSLPAGYGAFTVALTAVNEAGETATWTGSATRVPATMYVAKDSTPAFPYDTWETAAADLPSITPWCGDGVSVVMGDGVWTNTKASVFLNGASVRSLHGAGSTAIFSKTATTTLVLAHPRARAEGLTLFSDHVSRGMAAVYIKEGTFADSVVSNFYSSSSQIINLASPSAVLTNTTVIRNETSGRINTIHTTADFFGVSGGNIFNCRIIGNVGNNDTYGCAVFNYNGSLTMRNCLIACNTNKSTGASAVWMKSGSVENCTVAENYVGGSSTRAGFVVENSPPVRNCVIHGNRNTSAVANWSGTSASFTYCCTTPLPSGAGNCLAVDPLFMDGDWRTGAGPCKDAGLNQSWMADATDLDGGDRIADDTVDIGCYEYKADALECSAIPSASFLVGEGEVTLAASVTGPDTTGLSFTWLVTDQTGATIASVADSAAATNLVLTLGVGIYDVSLAVRNARGTEATFAFEGLVTVKPQTVYVANGAATAFPYTTHENAFTNILDAVSFAESGMRVIIADGTYTNTANATLSKNVVVESEHGADKTTIFVDNTLFTAWILNASGCALRNVTLLSDNAKGKSPATRGQRIGAARVYSGTLDGCVITNWYTYYESLFSVSGTRGVITNCTIANCRMYYRSYFSEVSGGGTLTHCRYLRNNSNNGSYSYGSILRVQGSSSNVRNCLFAENIVGSGTDLPEASVVYLADGTVENCTIADNVATDSTTAPAAYAAAGTFRNNVVWGNANKAGAAGCTAASASLITYSCAPNLAGTGCKAAAPCFRGAARGDYTLRAQSPCIDAGLNQTWMEGAATDLGGNPRVRRGYARGTVDMGCFESNGAVGTILYFK